MATHTSTAGYAQTTYFDCWPAGYLNGSGVLTSGSDEKVLVNQLSNTIILTNQSAQNVHMKVIRVRCRKTYDTSVASGPLALLNTNSVYTATTTPFLDPTTSTTFRRYYKILSVRVKNLVAGRSMTLRRKIYSKRGMVMRGDVEGLSSNWAYSGMYTTIIQFSSMPMVELGETEPDNRDPGIAACTIASSHSMKIVYRLIEDNDPDTNATTTGVTPVNLGVQYNSGNGQITANATGNQPLQPVYITDVYPLNP